MEEINLIIKRGPLDRRKRQLLIHPEFIEFEDKDLIADAVTRFDRNEITEFRFGINWIEGIKFTIGRDYQIFIRNRNKKVLKINFKCFYGIGKRELHRQYATIIEALWKFYFNKITNEFLNQFFNGAEFKIGDVHFASDQVIIKSSGIFSEQEKAISWGDLNIHPYATYLSIFSKKDSSNVNRGYSFLSDWNTAVLHSVLLTILQDRKMQAQN